MDTKTLEKGIVPCVVGGLGNQMFIITAGYIVHKYTNAPLYILQNTLENNPHNIKHYNYNDSIFKYFGTHLPISRDDIEVFSDYRKFELHNAFYPWFPEAIQAGTLMIGYYQFYPPIEVFENEIRNLFLKGLEDYRAKIPDYSNYAFLHVRHGDYLTKPDIHYIQPVEYYKVAVDHLLQTTKVQKILVFSDDINWVKSEPFFSSNIFEIYDSDDELETLACMSKCTAGAICANSTFSWWGAFLGTHGNRAPVYVPQRWMCLQVYSLFPKEWIILS
jgi:Glycosyl transferase family 11